MLLTMGSVAKTKVCYSRILKTFISENKTMQRKYTIKQSYRIAVQSE
jgi:hypothetical protein